MEKGISAEIANLEMIYRDTFGLWISSLFSSVEGHNKDLSFEDQKDIFFDILQLWLDQGRIKFCTPSDPLGEVWNVPSTIIIEYLRSHWPPGAADPHDASLNMYFYEMPAILWVGADGKLHGS